MMRRVGALLEARNAEEVTLRVSHCVFPSEGLRRGP